MIRHARVGMDVEVRDLPGTFMIVGLDAGDKVRVVCPAVPGELLVLPLDDLRECWPAASPAERLAGAKR